jgi:hypothetical protein
MNKRKRTKKKTLGWRLQACTSPHALSSFYKRKAPFLYGVARVRKKRPKMTPILSLPTFSFPTFLLFGPTHIGFLQFFFFFFHFFLVFYKIAYSFLFFFSFGIRSSVLGRDVLEPTYPNVLVFPFLCNST